MKTYNKKRSGFTVIELMIVVVIVGILVALAYPSYVQYVRKAKRGEAQQLLLNAAINQEIYRSNNTEYADDTDITPPTHDYYDFTVGSVTAASYTLQAAAKTGSDQVNDKARDGTECKTLSLNQSGLKSPVACWD